MLGERMARLFADVKKTLDPNGLMNPGNIVDPTLMDDRSLFRYTPEYGLAHELPVVLDWSAEGGLLGAVEACNNNGACRKSDPGVMCPSFRATGDERHSTRGRANALRLAMTGQLGHAGLDSAEMAEAMSLCISCKGCKRECPAGVDMAALKLEWQHRQNQRHGIPLRERLLADLPRQAPRLSRMATAINAAGNSRGLRTLAERHFGISKNRSLPHWSRRPWRDQEIGTWEPAEGPFADTLLFVDTFTRWFEPNVARAAYALLARTRNSVSGCFPADGRPLCCGRTYLSSGMLDEARREAERLVTYLHPYASLGVRIVGLEPSCVFTVKDEVPRLVPSDEARLVADSLSLFEEALDADLAGGTTLRFNNPPRHAAVHSHCHQKAAGAAEATLRLLGRVPGLEVTAIESGCCGMAGAFGYHAEHFDISMQMGELDLLPAVREQDGDTLIVAPGTSCRAQILDGTGRVALHPAEVLHRAL